MSKTCRKSFAAERSPVPESFYPWTASAPEAPEGDLEVRHEARIAVVDELSAAPRVLVVSPAPVRSYLEEITQTTYALAREQGGRIPFMVIREIVENLIHAYFADPVVTILPGGNTIRFSDGGPGIASKEQALEYGTTTATEAMKRYIRGVGSGLPYVRHFLGEKGGSLTLEDNLDHGTVVTMSLDEQPPAPAGIAWASPASEAVEETWAGRSGAGVSPTQPGALGAGAPFDARSTMRQSAVPPSAGRPAMPHPSPSPSGDVSLRAGDREILAYALAKGEVGPTELAKTGGYSLATWSRRLARLEDLGFLEKSGQKRHLTSEGERLARLLVDG